MNALRQLVVVLFAVVALAACRMGVTRLTLDGIAYEVQASSLRFDASDGRNVHVTTESAELWIVDGDVRLGGEDRGNVKAGDRVILARDGKLYVNGVERTAIVSRTAEPAVASSRPR
ncbi:MAG TPA: hypothetical protein VKE69_03010 [Planctomycetota bacterium]|nr:hypothetical protein [Planctomycetota bacterium]